MKDESRLIFRAEAIRHYAQGRNQSVLPHFTHPRMVILLWVFAALLISTGLLAWLIRVPVFASGVGVVIDSTSELQEAGEAPQLAVFLPGDDPSKFRVGQRLFWRFDRTGERVSRSIGTLEPQVSSPSTVQRRFKLTGASASAITKPVSVAFVSLEPVPGNLPASAYLGSVYRVDVEIAEMRVISLLPFIGPFFRVVNE